MKRLFLLLCLCYPLSIFAQIEQKPQRMGYESGFSSYYTLANQKIHTAEIELHLKKYSPNALNQYF